MNFYIQHNRWMPLQAEEALGPISIPQGSRGVVYIMQYTCVFNMYIYIAHVYLTYMHIALYINIEHVYLTCTCI
jgi:hypothetical protein